MASSKYGVYVHLPFCGARCTYCPFAISTDLSQEDGYLQALSLEILDRADPSVAVDSIFLGGGTPSRTGPHSIARIIGLVRESFDVDSAAEITIEANPEDISPAVVALWRDSGIGRISLGIQSLHDAELRPLGRVHGGEGAVAALRTVVASGAKCSADLILGLPGQTTESFHMTLEGVLAEGAGHISLYMLDLEEGTKLSRQVQAGSVTLPPDEVVSEMYLEAIDVVRRAGLHQYEISNFARQGEECIHNLKYWNRSPYYGFGLGAHSYLPEERFANTRELADYIDNPRGAEVFRERLSPAEIRHERIFLALRQAGGIGYSDLRELCGTEGERWMDEGISQGWLKRDGERLAFTGEGFLVSTEVISRLF
jgi:oxygen-independent coproporphyrinogen-3 oxidase